MGSSAGQKEEVLLSARLGGLIRAVREKNRPRFSHFLDEGQAAQALALLKREQVQGYAFFGGFDGAQRVMLGLCPDYLSPQQLCFPIAVLCCAYSKNLEIGHRDVLGSLMALGLRREAVGDFVFAPGTVYVALEETVTPWVEQNLTRIGRVGISISRADGASLHREQEFSDVSASVASLRLDAVLAAAARVSRGEACALLWQGRVLLNGLPALKPDKIVAPGDVLSVRKIGKFRIGESRGQTRRGRIYLTIQKYV